jgi:hypothetical protein
MLKIFSDLRQIRNKAAHAEEYIITSEKADEYIQIALKLNEYFNMKIEEKKASL